MARQKTTDIRLVFLDDCHETSSIAGRRRAFEEASKGRSDQGAAGCGQWTGASSSTQDWSFGWWRVAWNGDKGWNSWKDSPVNWWKKHEGGAKIAWQEVCEEEDTERRKLTLVTLKVATTRNCTTLPSRVEEEERTYMENVYWDAQSSKRVEVK